MPSAPHSEPTLFRPVVTRIFGACVLLRAFLRNRHASRALPHGARCDGSLPPSVTHLMKQQYNHRWPANNCKVCQLRGISTIATWPQTAVHVVFYRYVVPVLCYPVPSTLYGLRGRSQTGESSDDSFLKNQKWNFERATRVSPVNFWGLKTLPHFVSTSSKPTTADYCAPVAH